MPPRKRAETKPEAPEAAPGADETPELELPPDDTDAGSTEGTSPEPPTEDSPGEPEPPADTSKPSGDGPCPECFPNGWTEQATAVGCTHGNWTRDSK